MTRARSYARWSTVKPSGAACGSSPPAGAAAVEVAAAPAGAGGTGGGGGVGGIGGAGGSGGAGGGGGGGGSSGPPMGDLSDTWSCGGFIGDTRNSQARYYTTAFGCWTDSNGDPHSDPGDNCQPW